MQIKPPFNQEQKDKHFEIKFYDENQVDDKIALGIGGGFLCIHSNFVC